jgi:hypothetical protein
MGDTRTLANGAIYDMEKGRIVAMPNTAQASTLARARWDKHRERARSVLAATVGDLLPDVVDPLEPDAGTLVLLARTAQQVMDSQLPRPEAVDMLMQSAGAVPDKRERADTASTASVLDAIPPGFAVLIARMATQDARAGAIDADSTDAE